PLERLAAQLAAENVTPDDLTDLDHLVEQMHRAVTSNDVSAFRDADIAFHSKVMQVAGNPFLSRVWEVLEPMLRPRHAVADPLFEGDWSAMADEHGRLVTLLRTESAKAPEAFANHAAGRSPVPDRRKSAK